jgi:glycosyltransferase involved in cell wall biosynthesis
VCIFDNASNDDTAAVVAHLARFDHRIQYHRHPQNIGSYNNFNFGLRTVETLFFSLLSDDDMLAPEFYERAIKGFEHYPEAEFVTMATMVVDQQNRVLSAPIPLRETTYYAQGEAFEKLVKLDIPNTWTGMLFKKRIFDQIGFIDLGGGMVSDGGWVFHAGAKVSCATVPGVAAVLLAHKQSAGGSAAPMDGKWLDWWENMIGKIEKDEQVSEKVRQMARKIMFPNFRKIAVFQTLSALIHRDPIRAKSTVQGLHAYGNPLTAATLNALILLWKYVPLFASVLSLIHQQRHHRLLKKQDEMTKECQSHIAFIHDLEEVTRQWEKKFNEEKLYLKK